MLFKRAAPSDISRFPLVQGLAISDVPAPGEAASPGFAAALAVLKMGEEKRRGAARFSDQPDSGGFGNGGFRFSPFSPETGIFLGFDDFEAKFRRLAQVFDLLKQRNPSQRAAMIHVSDPQRVVVTWSLPRQADQPKEG